MSTTFYQNTPLCEIKLEKFSITVQVRDEILEHVTQKYKMFCVGIFYAYTKLSQLPKPRV